MLITLSGLDGAGKSTLTRWLKAALEERRCPALVLHMHHDVGVYAILRALRDRIFGVPTARRATSIGAARQAIVWNKTLRRLIYPVDLVVFLAYRLFIERVQRRVLIMDRYFYDTLVDVWDVRRMAWCRFLARLTPRPDVAVLLDVSPERAFARKAERSVDYLRARERAYHAVFSPMTTPLVLRGDDLNAAKAAIARAVAAAMGRAA